ncbi:pirin family protein [Halobacteria archaeon AArc-m2/3/4]|uniref:Pirin family protein n=1 Tax=Natronoglomus mannanivorans TaxID=2979990 RepID=A0ABT2QHF7_9EURY|nr:pirin family protein [Halobacteria archaeon AArc-m2/3/4]
MSTDERPTKHSIRDAAAVTHAGGMQASRAFPTNTHAHLDPFVLFERFHIAPDQGFDTHPHSGFEILTYMLEGGMAHGDSLGHESTPRAGDAMRITTGSGIRHSEFPADGACSGLQLWVNLPADRKEIEPAYAEASSDQLPTEQRADATVTTVVGEGSPLGLETAMEYLDVTVTGSGSGSDEGSWTWDPPAEWVGFCFVVSGSGRVGGDGNGNGDEDRETLEAGQFVTLEGGDSLTLSTDTECRVVAVAGEPHGQEIHQRGPFVA